MSILLLDQNTINKIAAGEVVERPASVIKELVENAIDAKADAITIEVKEGGLKFIRITDNGSGIHKDDVKAAFLRHSTSKIKDEQDLASIMSLGFRGEALASIASVGRVELITKQASESVGIRYIIEGGVEKSFEEVGCPIGTTFMVKDLFYNTPARRKFMKTSSTELGYISDLVQKLALGHPKISFKFINEGKIKLQTTGNNKLKDCIFSVYGMEMAKNLIEINWHSDGMHLEGFIGKPHLSRGNRTYENYFLNGRYIKSKVIEKAIEDGYKSKLMLHQYPFVTFYLHVDAKDVDVNVHPTKMEVRFMEEAKIFQLVYKGIEAALNKEVLIPQVSIEKEKKETSMVYEPIPEPFEEKRKNLVENETIISHHEPTAAIKTEIFSEEKTKEKPIEKQEAKPEETPSKTYKGDQVAMSVEAFRGSSAVRSHKVVGQLFDTYWIVELEEEYYMIDQHAAHEKVLYERMVKKLSNKVEFAQRLLEPIVVNLSLQEMSRYETYQRLFVDLGFEVEAFGEEALIIRSVPFVFGKSLEANQFLQILDGLADSFIEDKYDILLDDIASMACKAAVKGNDRLSQSEYIGLIDDLLTLENPFHCPHGRPTIIAMTKYELEKKFKRIQG
ncbi:DNA mismatch repair endonuclease MutL [Petrocella sp. FN5]|uniref:DNA mismatch repair endonuclease MutL n=1 Tax=Petrocella sp. FN5 TaxID=3032002 RepID=UPI0023DA7BBC|nr:DNA mismatch repair endonuclease MutL [Petrocella sp. FN5]MDF1617541.1 DNA mismatch repair endonuclease MutL [Petrocella sp. FN5]